jgi:tyrosyl-tRNA synthetase
MSLADLFVRAQLVASRGEARRKAVEGALWIDGQRVENVDAPFQPSDKDTLLRFGKKRYRRIHVVP